jgi:glycerophosphoryl diester phosphodiesterase
MNCIFEKINIMRYFYMLILSFMLFSCIAIKNNKNVAMENQKNAIFFDKQGHRGCRGLLPENTIPAMLKAIDLGVNTLEMDICFSKDKKAFLSHEPFFNHEITTLPNGEYISEKEETKYNMYRMSYDSIIKYDIGTKPHPRFPNQSKIKEVKPLLEDLILKIQEKCTAEDKPFPFLNIETKTQPQTDGIFHPEPEEFVNLLMEIIKKYKIEKQVTIQSFDFRTLQFLHKNHPSIATAMLIEPDDKGTIEYHIKMLGFVPTIYSPAYELVTKELVENCHQLTIKIIPWTVNTKEEIEKLKKLNVDGIITDYPNLFKN